MLSCLLISIFSCSDDKTNANGSGQPYDPNTPVKLETFYPDSGGMATKVIIKGTNFGTDPEAIKVYYNTKKAAVVRAAGDMLYVITPRQPGAECQISVAIGKDSLTFENTFSYTTQTTVSTIAGKPVGGDDGHGEMIDGTLAEASFDQPWFLCVDAEKNIFVSERLGHAVRQINEEKNVVSTLVKGSGNCPYPNASATDAEGKTVFVALDQGS
ncbi:IPT/TIG domain-containing protein, partial [Parabacteroides goldsteinii]